MNLLASFIPIGAAIAGVAPLAGITYLWKLKERREMRSSPLTRNMLRPPGYSIRVKINDASTDLLIRITLLAMLPLIVYSVHVSQSYFAKESESLTRVLVNIGIGVAVFVTLIRPVFLTLRQLKHLELGLDGEMATGEELNQLMLNGCRVFHDIPYPYGNIDHVVVSPSGVFAVNSKVLGRPKSSGATEVTVDQQSGVVRFPDREYRIPIRQFETEAAWLKKHLRDSVGQAVEVESILALPGWFIKERIGRGSVYVINPYRPHKFFIHSRQVLSAEKVQQIAHQLEQLVRDVKPAFQEKTPRWEDSK